MSLWLNLRGSSRLFLSLFFLAVEEVGEAVFSFFFLLESFSTVPSSRRFSSVILSSSFSSAGVFCDISDLPRFLTTLLQKVLIIAVEVERRRKGSRTMHLWQNHCEVAWRRAKPSAVVGWGTFGSRILCSRYQGLPIHAKAAVVETS